MGIRRKRRGIQVMAGVFAVGTVLALLALFEPHVHSTFSPYMWSEGMGRRQYDYKYFGLVPYSQIVPDKNLSTTKDIEDQFSRAGLVLPHGNRVNDKGAVAMRSHQPNGDSSTLYFDNVKDPAALYSFFRGQAASPTMNRKEPDGSWLVTWEGKNGDHVKVSLSYGHDPKTKKVLSNMLHMHVSEDLNSKSRKAGP